MLSGHPSEELIAFFLNVITIFILRRASVQRAPLLSEHHAKSWRCLLNKRLTVFTFLLPYSVISIFILRRASVERAPLLSGHHAKSWRYPLTKKILTVSVLLLLLVPYSIYNIIRFWAIEFYRRLSGTRSSWNVSQLLEVCCRSFREINENSLKPVSTCPPLLTCSRHMVI